MAARAAGVAGVELDVRLCADGTVVVHHDPALPDGRPIAELPAAELPAGVPTLRAALEVLQGALVDLEVKASPLEPGFDPDQGVARATVQTLAAWRAEQLARQGGARAGAAGTSGDPAATWLLTSFWPATLEALGEAAAAAGLPVAVGWLLQPGLDPQPLVSRAAALEVSWLLPAVQDLAPVRVRALQEAGFGVLTWTVTPGAAVAASLAAGVDGLIADEALAVAAQVRAQHRTAGPS